MNSLIQLWIIFAAFTGNCLCRLVDPSAVSCCRIPEFLDAQIIDGCAAKIIEDEDSPMDMAYGSTQEEVLFSPGIRCISQCIMNDIQLIVDDEIRLEPTMSTMSERFTGDQEWITAMQNAMVMCAEIVTKTPFKPLPSDECSYKPAFYMACLDTHIFQNCPMSHWKDAYGCAKLKEDSIKCPVLSAVLIRND